MENAVITGQIKIYGAKEFHNTESGHVISLSLYVFHLISGN
jgi:hypothetical protein